jgi:hypothetical protein
MVLFGKKISKSFNNFGKKASHGIDKFGKKVIEGSKQYDKIAHNILDKGFEVLDKAAPLAATAANIYAPGSGDAIMTTIDGMHGLRKAGGGAKQTIDTANKVFRSNNKGERKELVASFGDQIENTRDQINKSKKLLRDANNVRRTAE